MTWKSETNARSRIGTQVSADFRAILSREARRCAPTIRLVVHFNALSRRLGVFLALHHF
jgi:hypothetical protein